MKTGDGCKRIIAVSLCAILLFSFCAQLISSNFGKVKVTDVTLDVRGGSLNGDLYYPAWTDSNDNLPAIIVNHGGGCSKGQIKADAEELARRGFVVFNINDYNAGLSDLPNVLEPSDNPANGASFIDAINYIRSMTFVDSTRIGLVGHSMGSRRVGLAAMQDSGYYTLNDLLLIELHDNFGIEISADDISVDADQIAAERLDASQMEYYDYRKSEITEYYTTRVSAICLLGSNANPVSTIKTVDVAGNEVMRNCQVNLCVIDGNYDQDYYMYNTLDFAKEAWHTHDEDIELSKYYVMDDYNDSSEIIGDFEENHYGEEAFIAAVSARSVRAFTLNPESHSKNVFSAATSTDIVRFFTNVFQYNGGEVTATSDTGIAATSNIWWLREAFNFIALLSMLVMALALFAWMLTTKKLATAVAPVRESTPVSKKFFWIGCAISAVLGYLAIYLEAGVATNSPPPSVVEPYWQFFPLMSTTDHVFKYMRYAALFAALLVIGFIIFDKVKGRNGFKKLNLAVNIKTILKNLLIAVVVLIIAYISLSLIMYLFNQDYRIWVLSFTSLKVEHWGILLRYALMLLPMYLAMSCLTNYTIRQDWAPWKDDLVAVIVGSIGVWVIFAINIIDFSFAFSGKLWVVLTCVYYLPLMVPITTFINRKLYRLTNTVWAGALCNTMLIAWSLVSSTNLATYPQTWFSNFFGA